MSEPMYVGLNHSDWKSSKIRLAHQKSTIKSKSMRKSDKNCMFFPNPRSASNLDQNNQTISHVIGLNNSNIINNNKHNANHFKTFSSIFHGTCHVWVLYRITLASVTANKDIYLTQLWVLSQSKWVSVSVYVHVCISSMCDCMKR